MKIKLITLFVLLSGHLGAQQLVEKKTYYDYYGKYLHEVYHVLAGTPTKHGSYKEYDQNGDLLVEASFKNNKLNGLLTRYYSTSTYDSNPISTGVIKEKLSYSDDEIIEEWSFTEDGKKLFHRKVTGQCTYWHANGEISAIALLYPNERWPSGTGRLPKTKEFFKQTTWGNLTKFKEVKWYYEDGTLGIENYFNEDGVSTTYKEYDPSGKMTFEWYSENGKYTQVLYYETGEKVIAYDFKLEPRGEQLPDYLNAVFEGVSTLWDTNGNILNQGEYHNGWRVGKWTVYYDSDFSKEVDFPSEASYYRVVNYDENGKPVGIVKDHSISGQILWEGGLKSETPDRPIGECKSYYQNGQLKKIGNYNANGENHGEFLEYTEDGVHSLTDLYNTGQITNRIMYYESGKIKEEQIYEEIEYVDPAFTKMYGNSAPKTKMRVAKIKAYYENGTLSTTGTWRLSSDSSTKLGEWIFYYDNGEFGKKEVYDASGLLQ
ncbi:hypothetical protein [Reichenbachiella sp.]|uniref:toxin-antitoxin system YwqK family antitoxin n=1 Tax=Reichenbachiella sp. TaxID=2184521 RepID=UPI003B5CEAF7